MTAIFLNDVFYLVDNMSLDEILEIANEEGLNSPKIRSRAVMQLNANFYSSAMIKGFLPSIQRGLFQLSDKYLVKTIRTIEDLEYFIGPDNKKYTCDMDYYSSLKKDLSESAVDRVEDINDGELVVEEEVNEDEPVVIDSDESNELNEKRKEKVDEAAFLDSFLSKYHKVTTFISDTQLPDVERYVAASKEDLDREVKTPFLSDARIIDIIDGDLGINTIENAIGSSNNMLDSLLTFPVFSAIVGRRNLSEKFSMLALEGSDFVRICPVGVDENGNLFGFVHMIRLTSPLISKVENEIKSELKKQGKKFASLTPSEKYKRFEEKFAEYYTKNSGKMLMASGSRKYVNIVEFITNMTSKKYAVPTVFDNENKTMLWPSHEIIAFDNRGRKTLKEQVEAIYSSDEVVSGDRKPRFIQTEVVSESEEVIVAETVDEVAEDTISTPKPKNVSLNLTLFESLVAINGNDDSSVLSLHNQMGEVVSQISTKKVSPSPRKVAMKPGVLNAEIVPGSITMESKRRGFDAEIPISYEVEPARKK